MLLSMCQIIIFLFLFQTHQEHWHESSQTDAENETLWLKLWVCSGSKISVLFIQESFNK